jgi:hypothetical protein
MGVHRLHRRDVQVGQGRASESTKVHSHSERDLGAKVIGFMPLLARAGPTVAPRLLQLLL